MKRGTTRTYCRASWAEIARDEFKLYARFNGINKLKDEIVFYPEWYRPEIRYKIAKRIRRYYLTD